MNSAATYITSNPTADSGIYSDRTSFITTTWVPADYIYFSNPASTCTITGIGIDEDHCWCNGQWVEKDLVMDEGL